MSTIWKFPLQGGIESIDMPIGAELVSAGVDDNGQVCAWALVDPTARLEKRKVGFIGTGSVVPVTPNGWQYVGIARMGPYVWHVLAEGRGPR